MSGHGDSTRAIFYALAANLGIFVAKFAAALFTGSGAMMAEAVHSLADCGNQGLLLLGIKRAKLPPTPDFPLGYGKETYFWSFLVALMLFSIGGAFSIYEGVHKLKHPEPLELPWLAVGVLLFSIVLEWLSLRACLQEIDQVREKNSLWHWFLESRNSEMIVLFGEQLAALLGLVFALFAIGLSIATGNPMFDSVGTIGIGVLLIIIAVFVAIKIKALLIGQSVVPARRKEIEAYLHSHADTMQIFNVITLQLGPEIMVAVKAGMNPDLRAAEMIVKINKIEAEMRQQFPEIRWLFFEPDLDD